MGQLRWRSTVRNLGPDGVREAGSKSKGNWGLSGTFYQERPVKQLVRRLPGCSRQRHVTPWARQEAHNMQTNASPQVRKRILPGGGSPGALLAANEIDLVASATILYSSEDPGNPVESLFDGRSGRGATRWASARPNAREEIVIEFDRPQRITRMIFEAEELHVERTQQVTIEYSMDRGETFRRCLVQEYTFSPGGSTFEREDLGLDLREVTHIRLLVVPDKGGSGTASLTSLRLFS